MMGLLDDLTSEIDAVYEGRCAVRRWLLTLDDKTRADVDEVIASNIEATRVHAFLSKRFPIDFTETALQSHRRALKGGSGCKCRS